MHVCPEEQCKARAARGCGHPTACHAPDKWDDASAARLSFLRTSREDGRGGCPPQPARATDVAHFLQLCNKERGEASEGFSLKLKTTENRVGFAAYI